MHANRIWAGFLIAALGAAAGCEEDELPLGEGPSAGDGGGDARAGAGGTDAGSAGRGAGGGGRVGAGGTPGAGRGGAPGGTAGMAGGGTAGICDGEADPPGPLLTFPECPEPPFYMTGSTCSVDATREALGCGEPGTTFRADCCLRQICEEDAECGPGARCIPRLAQAPDAWGGTLVEDCQSRCDECGCTITDDIDFQSYCVDASEDIARFDCNLEGRSCDELALWRLNLRIDDFFFDEEGPLRTYEQRIDVCADAVNQALVERCGDGACTCEQFRPGEHYECDQTFTFFCPASELGCPLTLERMTAGNLCRESADFVRYTECDENVVRFEWMIDNENDYEAWFDRRSGNLRYGTANGYVAADPYVARSCGLDPGWLANITTAERPPFVRSCRSCQFCVHGEGGASGVDPCVVDDEGRISLP